MVSITLVFNEPMITIKAANMLPYTVLGYEWHMVSLLWQPIFWYIGYHQFVPMLQSEKESFLMEVFHGVIKRIKIPI